MADQHFLVFSHKAKDLGYSFEIMPDGQEWRVEATKGNETFAAVHPSKSRAMQLCFDMIV